MRQDLRQRNILKWVHMCVSGMTMLLASSILAPVFAQERDSPATILVIEGISIPLLSASTGHFERALPEFFEAGHALPDVVQVIFDGRSEAVKAGMIQAIEAEQPDLIVLMSTIALRAFLSLPEYHHIPVVFTYVTNPVGEGVVAAIGETSPLNMTGFQTQPHMGTKLDMAQTVLQNRPAAQPVRIGYLIGNYPSAVAEAEWLEKHGEIYGALELVPIPFQADWQSGDVEAWVSDTMAALEPHRAGLEGLWLAIGPSAHNLGFLKALAAATDLPWFFGPSDRTVEQGASFGLDVSTEIVGRELARRVQSVLSGKQANSLTIDYPREVNVIVNIETMLKMGIVPPSVVLELAGPFIYTQEKL